MMRRRACSEGSPFWYRRPSINRFVYGKDRNHLRFNTSHPKDGEFYTYRVHFEPPVELATMRCELIEMKIDTASLKYEYDGGTRIYSTRKLRSKEYRVTGYRNFEEPIHIIISEVPRDRYENVHRFNTQSERNRVTKQQLTRSETAHGVIREALKADRLNFVDYSHRSLPGSIVRYGRSSRNSPIDDVDDDIVFFRSPINNTSQPAMQIAVQEDNHLEQQGMIRENIQYLHARATEQSMSIDGGVEILENSMGELVIDDEAHFEMPNWGDDSIISSIDSPRSASPAEEGSMFRGEESTQSNRSQLSSLNRCLENLRRPRDLVRWAIVCLRWDRKIVDRYCRVFRRVADPLVISLLPPEIIYLDNDTVFTYVQACKKLPQNCQLANVIVPNNYKDRYDAIKTVFWCENPMASQIITTNILKTRIDVLRMICTKIWLQMTTKLGAEALVLHVPMENTMVAGYNCCYDGILDSSAGALVCSLNKHQSQWYSRVSYHKSLMQMSHNLSAHLKDALREYKFLNGRFPERLLIYRAGFSENQIFHICNSKMVQIKDVLSSLMKLEEIRWALALVFDRAPTQNFVTRSSDNPPYDRRHMVETLITRRGIYDFYIVNQSVCRTTFDHPMHKITEDTTGWKSIHHQQLANRLCHSCSDWAGTISAPIACQYAEKLAHLAASSLHLEPDRKHWKSLFYL